MTCQEVMDYMQRQLDGDLDDRETDILNKHTGHCPECAAMLERLQRLSDELDSLPKVTPPFSLVDAILPQLDELDRGAAPHAAAMAAPEVAARRTAPTERRKSWLERLPLKTLSGFVAASIVAGFFIFNYTVPEPVNEAAESMALRSMTGGSEEMNSGGELPGEEEGAPESAGATELFGVEVKSQEGKVTEQPAEDAPAVLEDSPAQPPLESPSEPSEPVDEPTAKQPNAPTVMSNADQPPSTRSETTERSNQKNFDANADSGGANEATPSAGTMQAPQDEAATGFRADPDARSMAGPLMDQVPSEALQEALPSAADVARSYANADAIASPDGQLKVTVDQHVLQVYGSDGNLVFESRKQPGSSIRNPVWSADSLTLTYELYPAPSEESGNAQSNGDVGVERYVVQLKDGTESRQ
ncbi:anti-sigma factor [Paenibacillus sp. 598K]|uniref:anti-sigma factor n=1 Tax=Paenibacillus sp. 598K TaxID=1117987 RepID=UPI000FFEB914|nr:anti-sigma factor [Paenibacillus sp. 598K]